MGQSMNPVQEKYRKMLKELNLNDEDELSKWEADFCDSCSQQEWELTEKQRKVIDTIYNKVFK